MQWGCGTEVMGSSSFNPEETSVAMKNSVHQIRDLNLAVAMHYCFSFPEI